MTSYGCQIDRVRSCVFDKTNTVFAMSSCSQVKVFDIYTQKVIHVFNIDDVLLLTFNYNSTLIIARDFFEDKLLIFDMVTGKIQTLHCNYRLYTAISCPNKNMVILLCLGGLRYFDADVIPYQIKIYNIKFNQLLNLKLSPDGNILLARPIAGKTHLLNFATLTEFNIIDCGVFCASFSNCSNFIVTVECNNCIYIYSINGNKIREFGNHEALLATFNDNDTLIIAQCKKDIIKILNATTGDIVRIFNGSFYIPLSIKNYCNKYVVTCSDRHEIILHNTSIVGKHTKPALCETSLNETLLNEPLSTDASLNKTLLNEPLSTDASLNKTLLNEPLSTDALLNETLLNEPLSTDTSLNKTLLNEPLSTNTSLNDVSSHTLIIPNPELDLDLSELVV